MKLLKWSKKAAKNAKDDQLFLRLSADEYHDTIDLLVVNKAGEPVKNGQLLYYTPKRKSFTVCGGVSDKLSLFVNVFGEPTILTRREVHLQYLLHKKDRQEFARSHEEEFSIKHIDLNSLPPGLRDSLKSVLESLAKSEGDK